MYKLYMAYQEKSKAPDRGCGSGIFRSVFGANSTVPRSLDLPCGAPARFLLLLRPPAPCTSVILFLLTETEVSQDLASTPVALPRRNSILNSFYYESNRTGFSLSTRHLIIPNPRSFGMWVFRIHVCIAPLTVQISDRTADWALRQGRWVFPKSVSSRVMEVKAVCDDKRNLFFFIFL
jgi:hypothetical protein